MAAGRQGPVACTPARAFALVARRLRPLLAALALALAGLQGDAALPVGGSPPLRIFIYDLPSEFNEDLLDEIEELCREAGSACSWMRTVGAEAIVLRRLMASGLRVQDPLAADLFVVPYLVAADCWLRGWLWRCAPSALSHKVFYHLPHYGHLTRHRHLFLGTADIHSLPLVIQAQTLLISSGAKGPPGQPGHIVVPPAVVDPALQPPAWESGDNAERDILLFLAGAPNNGVRVDIFTQVWQAREMPWILEELGAEEGHIVLHVTGRPLADEGAPTFPDDMIDRLRRSRLCPVVPGENSNAGSKRLFDVLFAGCLPVVVAFHTEFGSGVSWWRHNGAPIEWSLPFPDLVDWSRLAIEVPAHELVNDYGFLRAALRATRDERDAKLRYLREIRSLLVYHVAEAGKSQGTETSVARLDAFNMVLHQVSRALAAFSVGPRHSVCNFFPLSLGIRRLGESGFQMFSPGKQKEWNHQFAEVSCQPAALWQDPAVNEAAGGPDPPRVWLERFVTRRIVRGMGSYGGVLLRSLERRARDGDLAREDLMAASFASCLTKGLPVACHDTLLRRPSGKITLALCSQVVDVFDAGAGRSTSCRLPPEAAPVAAAAAGASPSLRLEVVTSLCRLVGRPDEGSFFEFWRSEWDNIGLYNADTAAARAAIGTFQVVAYETCADNANASDWTSDSEGSRALVEHVLSGVHAAQQRQVGLADIVLLLPGPVQQEQGAWSVPLPHSASAYLALVLEALGEKRLLEPRPDSKPWIMVSYHPEGDESAKHPCELYQLAFQLACSARPRAINYKYGMLAFPGSLLSRVLAVEWEIASGVRENPAADIFHLLVVLLMNYVGDNNLQLFELNAHGPPAREPPAEKRHQHIFGSYVKAVAWSVEGETGPESLAFSM